MATSNKIKHAYTSKDIKTLECAMISKTGTDINSIDKSYIVNPIEIVCKETS